MPTEAASVGLFEWLPASTALTPLGLPTEASRHLDGSSECFAASAGQECRDLRVISVVRLCSLSEFGVPADVTVLPHFGCSFELRSQNTAGASAEGERGRSTEFRVLPSLFLLFFVCLFVFFRWLSLFSRPKGALGNTQQSHKVTRERPGYWHQQCGPHPLGKTLLAISSGREPLACVSTWIREAPPPTRSRASEYERRCCTFGLRNTFFVSLPTSTRQAFQLPARVDAFLFFHCFVGVAFSLYWYKSQL